MGMLQVVLNMNNLICFKKMSNADLLLLKQWFSIPHVKKWYARGKSFSLEEIKEKYLPRIMDKDIESYIVSFDKKQIGYIQIYYLPKYLPDNLSIDHIQQLKTSDINTTVGLDVFFAEKSYLGKGISSQALSKFMSEMLPDHVNTVIVDPLKENSNALAFFERNKFIKLDLENNTINCYMIRKIY